MNWKKFLSRKFLLAVAILGLAIADWGFPSSPNLVHWAVVSPILAYIFGEAGYDIIIEYIEWTKPKG